MNTTFLSKAAPVLLTLAIVAVAMIAGRQLWIHYRSEPWPPDGRVRADIVQIAPDVSGTVTDLAVGHDQPVKAGQFLFQLDPERYALALHDAESAERVQEARLAQLQREVRRNQTLGELVSREAAEQTQAHLDEARAALAQARAQRELAALNLKRTRIVAPADGTLSDLTLRVGNYVAAGKPVMALIDSRSLRVEGYFEETKLPRINVGQTARVHLMGDDRILTGHVQSIAAGIEDRDRTSGSSLLPNVNPTFSWVRLAQRIPVRIALDAPHDPALIAGRTATVTLLPPTAERDGGPAR